ncbi:hypothetical protein H0H92_003754 [Tricholoma furcatifolium]|nr:hypothetical protein H0H92_003754 [Tricholoma furcatifolium]
MPRKHKQYFCDCPEKCKRLKEVSKSTFYNHQSYRTNNTTNTHPQRASGPSTRRNRTSRRENEEDNAHTSEESTDERESQIIPRASTPFSGPQTDLSRSESGLAHSGSSVAHRLSALGSSRLPSPELDLELDLRQQPNLAPSQNVNDPRPSEEEDEIDPVELSDITDIRRTQQYILCLRNATLDNGDLTEDDIDALLHPSEQPTDFDGEDKRFARLSLGLFMGSHTVQSYQLNKTTIENCFPDARGEILSYDQVKRLVANITGVRPIVKHMCPNSCIAYTGPLSDQDTCHYCGEPRYDADLCPRRTFETIPIPSSIQALYRHPQSAQAMAYFRDHIKDLLTQIEDNGGLDRFDDIICGTDILRACSNGEINEDDTLLMLSLDGAQIYRNKASDCWIYIWTFINLAPGMRYKKKYVFPGGVFPGPNKIKDAQSFLFPGLHPIVAINRAGGLRVWNASTRTTYLSKIYIVLATADGPGMVYLNGLVGHSGKIGCRLWCGLVGRKKLGSSYYFPLLSKPDNYNIRGCDHDDVPPHIVRDIDINRYHSQLATVIASRNRNEYEINRRETGICRPSVFSGLPEKTYLGIPHMFPCDIMHLILNLADLLIPLWRGTFECAETDSRDTWRWAVLRGEIWQAHGRDVARCTPYLPGSFDRPPRNPAEKINSGYKAWEYLIYIFGLGPGLLYGVLPLDIWQSYCKLVSAIRILYQHSITSNQLQVAHLHLIQFIAEFETQYVQRREDRIPMARQSIHGLSHLAREVARVGPGITYSQWTMERTIGNLTEELRQHSVPYQHLSRRAVERAEINALLAMVPSLDTHEKRENTVPHGAIDLNDGYILLRAMDSCARSITDLEAAAFQDFLGAENVPYSWPPRLVRWARLRLPNGQVARSLWKESQKAMSKVRMARNVKLTYSGNLEFGEVLFFFRYEHDSELQTLAMISLYSRPNAELLQKSSNTLWTCKKPVDDRIIVTNVKSIEAVVCMAPHSVELLGNGWENWVFVVEKPGLDVANLGGAVELIEDE